MTIEQGMTLERAERLVRALAEGRVAPMYPLLPSEPMTVTRLHVGVDEPGVLWMAMRYALGRATYAVGEVVDAIAAHAHELPQQQRDRMADEVQRALDQDGAGMECDRENWRRAIALLRGSGGGEVWRLPASHDEICDGSCAVGRDVCPRRLPDELRAAEEAR